LLLVLAGMASVDFHQATYSEYCAILHCTSPTNYQTVPSHDIIKLSSLMGFWNENSYACTSIQQVRKFKGRQNGGRVNGRCLVRILAGTPTTLTEVFHRPLQANFGIVPYLRQPPLSSTSFKFNVHCHSIIPRYTDWIPCNVRKYTETHGTLISLRNKGVSYNTQDDVSKPQEHIMNYAFSDFQQSPST
jgi:hypothetical protein